MERENIENSIRILKALNRDIREEMREMWKEINDLKLKIGAVFEKHYDKKKE